MTPDLDHTPENESSGYVPEIVLDENKEAPEEPTASTDIPDAVPTEDLPDAPE